ncbi:MAG: hypothetical protein HYY25_12125 [Candidatus Wallbacteria bacterium]|nr:hypothetical protein [Candidatus Wallbacteria bacterium]
MPLFINALTRTLDLAQAMDVRCYKAGGVRGRFRVYPIAEADLVALAAASALFPLLFR